MRAWFLYPALPVTLCLTAATPALARPVHAATPGSSGEANAGRIVWTQVLSAARGDAASSQAQALVYEGGAWPQRHRPAHDRSGDPDSWELIC